MGVTRWVLERLRQIGWSLAMVVLMVAELGVGVALLVGVALTPIGGAFLTYRALRSARWLADVHRLWAVRVMGRPIARPYRDSVLPSGFREGFRAVTRDPASWRDARWLGVDLTAGLVTGGLPGIAAGSVVTGLGFLVRMSFRDSVAMSASPTGLDGLPSAPADPSVPAWVLHDQLVHGLTLVFGIGSLALFVVVFLPGYLMRAYLWLLESMLGPPRSARLASRIDELTRTRNEMVDTQSAEVRRIERDLHDGAQARLVALGMSLGMAEKLLEADPRAAKALLGEAKQSTGQALSELRTLVRGIHPPILADRGLDGAVRALAMNSAIPVELTIELPGRVPAPVESAVYFALTEIMANVAKHSGASQVWIRLAHENGRLDVLVSDDGQGGATVSPGGGLHGIERRLAAFDGTVFVTSPVGGPTIVSLGIPCDLVCALS